MSRRASHAFPWAGTAMALAVAVLVSASPYQKRKNQEPKSEVLPLPPQPPMALKAETQSLDFHLSPLLKTGGLETQIRASLNDLLRDTRGERIIKLRAFVAGAGDARRVQALVTQLFTDHKQPLPVLSVLQVGALGVEAAKVSIEAVVSTRRVANPQGLAFFAGQMGPTLAGALQQLQSAVAAAGVGPDSVLTATCFGALSDGFESQRAALQTAFPHANVNLVQPLRAPFDTSSLCEAVGQLRQEPAEGPVVLLAAHRAALVSARELVFTGLQLSFGSYLDDAHEAFVRLEHAVTALAPVEAPVEVNVFALDPSGASAVRKTTAVPPSTLSVQTVEGLPSIDASAGLEAVMAAGITAPALRP